MHILYVEDDADTALAFKIVLEQEGYQIDVVHTARDAKAICTEVIFDLLILDVGLPDAHGGDLLRTLRRICDTKAIAVTGYGMPQHIEEGMDDGFDAYLTKPVTMDLVLKTISELSGSKQPTEQSHG
jgi:two-component system CheB/CheR fusion protein